MSLLSVDIAKVKRLSLKEVILPISKVEKVETATPIPVGRPPTNEEILYSKMLNSNPFLAELVESLDLVSSSTGERIKKVELKEEEPLEIDKPKLLALAKRIIEGDTSYSKQEIVERIKQATNISQERAERGFNLMLQAGAIEPTPGDSYYLTGSSPF